jgi:hypothetical protein
MHANVSWPQRRPAYVSPWRLRPRYQASYHRKYLGW